jgi:hypothetical protein
MVKAKKTKTKKAKQSTQLPLDNMRWRPVAEVIERLSPHIGNKTLTANDLTEALASKKIRCMRRHTNEHTLNINKFSDAELCAIASGKVAGEMGHHQPAGHRQLLPASFWAEYRFACSPNGDIRVGFRLPPNHHGPSKPSFTLTANWTFYLWEPDCVKVWPALAPQATAAREADASEPPSPRRKPGRKPRGNWKLEVATEVGLYYRQGKPIPAANELAQFCQDELGFQPDISEIQKWLRQLLG